MPVTARLSQKFYERFGDEIANELVDWFNAVDMTYQWQLKEVNELNWARAETRFSSFDDRLDAFAATFEARLDALEAGFNSKLEALENRFDSKLEALENRFDSKLEALENRFDSKLEALEARVDAKLQRLRSELILWMFGFWTATVLPLMGLMLALNGKLN
jgi:DNA repair exonuclease SbcCD ATPase subunit